MEIASALGDGILLDIRPAAAHRRAGLGEGESWRFVGAMREKFDDDIAADRAVRQVDRGKLFHRETQIEIEIDRVMDTLEGFHAWLDDFSADKLPSHDWLYRRLELALAQETPDTRITVRGPVKIGVLRKVEQQVKDANDRYADLA